MLCTQSCLESSATIANEASTEYLMLINHGSVPGKKAVGQVLPSVACSSPWLRA